MARKPAPAERSTAPARKAAVIGGNRIPFGKAGGAYASAANLDMLTAALTGLVARFTLQGERIGDVAGGAVLKRAIPVVGALVALLVLIRLIRR